MAKREPWYSRTEAKLYNYLGISTAIVNLRAQIMLLQANMVPPKAKTYNRIGPPSTGERATEPERYTMDRDQKIKRLEAKIAIKKAEKLAIDTAMERLGSEEKDLVEKWFFRGWKLSRPDMQIWTTLKICRAEFYGRKREIVIKIAKFLGELVEDE